MVTALPPVAIAAARLPPMVAPPPTLPPTPSAAITEKWLAKSHDALTKLKRGPPPRPPLISAHDRVRDAIQALVPLFEYNNEGCYHISKFIATMNKEYKFVINLGPYMTARAERHRATTQPTPTATTDAATQAETQTYTEQPPYTELRRGSNLHHHRTTIRHCIIHTHQGEGQGETKGNSNTSEEAG